MTRLAPRSILIVLVTAAACIGAESPYGAYPTAAQAGLPAQNPTHAPTPEATWAELENRAAATATQPGRALGEHFRLTSGAVAAGSPCQPQGLPQPMCVDRAIQVEANHCYTIAVAWGYAAKVHVDLELGGVSDSLGARAFEGEGGTASGELCADHAGTAQIRISALADNRAMLLHELLEYAVAVGGRAERREETAARRQTEAASAAATQADQTARSDRAKLDCDQCTREEENCRSAGRENLDCYMERRKCDDRIRDSGC